jgi:DNA-binding IclR family transcriptional regulator
LEYFHGDVIELGASELGHLLDLHKNSILKLLATLESRGYIEQNKITENYRLGLKTLELGQTFIYQLDLQRRSRPVLEDLVRECNETSYFAILKEFNIIYLDCVETDMAVRVVTRVGSWLPAYCTAAGKIQIAYMRDSDLEIFLNSHELMPYTSNTITDREVLKNQLKLIAKQGYAIDDEEFDMGVKCVSAPVLDYTRKIIGAVSITGPAMRFDTERMEKKLIPQVMKSAAVVSSRLGYRD